MLYAVLTISIVILVIGLIKWKLVTLTIIKFMKTKNYTLPTDEELKACSQEVIKSLFKR